MNIAYYSHYFVPEIGAPSARIADMSQQWIKMGHRVQVVTCFPNHPMGKLYPGYSSRLYLCENWKGIDVHRHWTYITPNKGFIKKTLGHVSYLPSALLLSNTHMSVPDVAVGTSPTFFAAMAAAGFAMRHRLPFIMEVRDLWPAIFVELGVLRNPRLIRWLERLEFFLYRRATRIVTVTEAFRRNLIGRGVPQEKVFTIPNGADIDFWKPQEPSKRLRKHLDLENSFVVLYIGAHGISHALGRILESANLLREYPQIRFLFIGEGADKEQLVRQAQQLRLKNVTFLNSVKRDKVLEFYALADVCLVPLKNISLFETFIPSKMFEIMAMARPIIGSLNGEAADILRRSGGAIVVEPEDTRAIADSILYLIGHREQARAMGQRGRAFVTDHYSRRTLAGAYIAVMKETVAEYRGTRE